MNRKKINIVSAILLCFVMTGCGKEADLSLDLSPAQDTESYVILDTQEQEPQEEAECYIYVCGAVAHPGVYTLKENARVYEAIEAAGGFLPEADEEAINQAECVMDGQMIKIPTTEESLEADSAEAEVSDGRINLNTASAEELTQIPGIGEAKAQLIISYRETNGAFLNIEDIMNVSGIGEGTFSKLKDYIKVK